MKRKSKDVSQQNLTQKLKELFSSQFFDEFEYGLIISEAHIKLFLDGLINQSIDELKGYQSKTVKRGVYKIFSDTQFLYHMVESSWEYETDNDRLEGVLHDLTKEDVLSYRIEHSESIDKTIARIHNSNPQKNKTFDIITYTRSEYSKNKKDDSGTLSIHCNNTEQSEERTAKFVKRVASKLREHGFAVELNSDSPNEIQIKKFLWQQRLFTKSPRIVDRELAC